MRKNLSKRFPGMSIASLSRGLGNEAVNGQVKMRSRFFAYERKLGYRILIINQMNSQMIIHDDYGVYHVKIDQIEDLSNLSPQAIRGYESFTNDGSLYFNDSFGCLDDGTPHEIIIQDVYDIIEAHTYGISLPNLQELFEGIDVTSFLEMLIREGLVRAIQMTPKVIVYKTMGN